jgi:hydrogenase expression/formation protein HypC
MCLAIPGKIVEIYQEDELRMGKLDFGGTVRKCCLQYIPDAVVGDFALVHVGFAISLVDEAEAVRTYELLAEMGELMVQIDAEAAESPERPGAQR